MLRHVYREITTVLQSWRVWLLLASLDIKLRYRRSLLGPLWLTLSMMITISSIGFIYAHIFHVDVIDYLPYMASGIIAWSYISSLIIDSSKAYIDSEAYIKNHASHLSLYIMRSVTRNTLILLHNMLAYLPILFFVKNTLGFATLQLLPSIFIIALNGLFWGNLLAMLGTRFRDIVPIATTITQLIFFITPIMWLPYLLPEHYQWIVNVNPFTHFVELIRAPMLNQLISQDTIAMTTLVTCLGFINYGFSMIKYHHKIVFWL